jgi:SAM-dependent methyltransferase
VRERFDDDAAAYERSRPVAPDEVFDEIVAVAGLRPGSAVVEIGPGTGQATVPLARRGLRIVAVELGEHLADLARRNVAGFPAVDVVTSSFEAWSPGTSTFDAVVACNSLHWVDPAVRFAKPAAVLRPGGHLVVVSMTWVVPDDADPFWWDVQDDWAAVGAERVDPATKHPDRVGDLAADVRAADRFGEPIVHRHLSASRLTAGVYALNLSTQSTVKELDPVAGTELVRRVRRRIERLGGEITAHLLTVSTMAPRRETRREQ